MVAIVCFVGRRFLARAEEADEAWDRGERAGQDDRCEFDEPDST